MMVAAFYGLRLATAAPTVAPTEQEECTRCVALEEQLAQTREENDALREQLATVGHGERVGVGRPVAIHQGLEADNAVAIGHDIAIDGRVLGDAVAIGGTVRIGPSGAVDGDAVSVGGRIEVSPGGTIGGKRLEFAPGLSGLDGDVLVGNLAPPALFPTPQVMSDLVHATVRRLIGLLLAAGVGLLVLGVFPRRVRRVARDIEDRPVRSAVIGTLASGFLLVFSTLFTLVTLGLGSPVAAVLVAVLVAAWLLGFVALCQAVGDRFPLFDATAGRGATFLIGVTLVTLLASLPWVGWLVGVSASFLGIGSALSSGFGTARAPDR